MKAKAVLYARVSSKEQEREGFSIPAQLKLLRDYAKNNSLTIVAEFIEAETAKQAGRKQFRKMLDFLEDNADVKDILVEKVDRMYRNFHDSVALQSDSKHLRLHFVKQGKIYSKESKSHEKLHHDIDLAVANYTVNNLSEEVKKGSDEKASQGGWPGPAPLGYKNRLEDRTIIIHPEESVLIRKAFELASTGQYSLQRLSDTLYKMGLRSKRAKNRLSKSAVSRVLNNPFYYGYFWRKKKLYEAAHESIITKTLFDQVQEKMGYVKKPASTKLQLAYRGTITCAHCGCAITGEIKKKQYVYYRCTNGKRICNNVVYLKEETIEEEIKLALQKIKLPQDIIEWTRSALLDASKTEQTDRETQISILNKRYEEIDRKISRAYDHFLEGVVDREIWELKNEGWKQEKVEIQHQLDTLELDNDTFMNEGIRMMELASRASTLFESMTSDEKRELVSLVLSNSQIENGSLRYDYRKPFNYFQNVTDLEKWRANWDEFRTYLLSNAA